MVADDEVPPLFDVSLSELAPMYPKIDGRFLPLLKRMLACALPEGQATGRANYTVGPSAHVRVQVQLENQCFYLNSWPSAEHRPKNGTFNWKKYGGVKQAFLAACADAHPDDVE